MADPEQQLAWEARRRRPAGAAAIAAAVLTLGGDLWATTVLRDEPNGGYLESLQNAAKPGPEAQAQSVRTPEFRFIDDHAGSFVAAYALKAIGLLAIAATLTYLVLAIRARRPTATPVVYLPAIGGVLASIGTVAYAVAYTSGISAFLGGPTTVERAQDITGSGFIWATLVLFTGSIVLSIAFILVSLNAMRTGLLTRFMGIVGVIVGVLVILQFGPLPVVQGFWLAALGALILGYWPSGLPPAWRTGKAEPWPSQAEAAAERRKAMDARRTARRGAEPAPAATAPAERPEPAAAGAAARARRKRKKRR